MAKLQVAGWAGHTQDTCHLTLTARVVQLEHLLRDDVQWVGIPPRPRLCIPQELFHVPDVHCSGHCERRMAAGWRKRGGDEKQLAAHTWLTGPAVVLHELADWTLAQEIGVAESQVVREVRIRISGIKCYTAQTGGKISSGRRQRKLKASMPQCEGGQPNARLTRSIEAPRSYSACQRSSAADVCPRPQACRCCAAAAAQRPPPPLPLPADAQRGSRLELTAAAQACDRRSAGSACAGWRCSAAPAARCRTWLGDVWWSTGGQPVAVAREASSPGDL